MSALGLAVVEKVTELEVLPVMLAVPPPSVVAVTVGLVKIGSVKVTVTVPPDTVEV